MEQYEEFCKNAIDKFGDKVSTSRIVVNEETLKQLNDSGYNLKQEDFDNYDQVWILDQEHCPSCGAELMGLFGSFQWGIVHGEGSCTHCNDVLLRYYQYIGESKKPLTMFSLTGF